MVWGNHRAQKQNMGNEKVSITVNIRVVHDFPKFSSLPFFAQIEGKTQKITVKLDVKSRLELKINSFKNRSNMFPSHRDTIEHLAIAGTPSFIPMKHHPLFQ